MADSFYLQTCRFCKESDHGGTETMVKYGVRHHAHYRCYLKAEKLLSKLHDWQIVLFPYTVLQDFNQLAAGQAAYDRIQEDRRVRRSATIGYNEF